jgi:glutathione-independent formaldehyde dehydrogenase
MRYNRQLMMAILHDRLYIAKTSTLSLFPLDQAPQEYHEFDLGARKYILDPHGVIAAR